MSPEHVNPCLASPHIHHLPRLTLAPFPFHASLSLKCTLPFSIPPPCSVQLKLWIDEKMLTAQDVSYDEARNLHTKWQKHQAFMAELAANKDWLDKVDKVSNGMGAARREPLGPPPVSIPAAVQGRVLASGSGLEIMEPLVPNFQGGKK